MRHDVLLNAQKRHIWGIGDVFLIQEKNNMKRYIYTILAVNRHIGLFGHFNCFDEGLHISVCPEIELGKWLWAMQ